MTKCVFKSLVLGAVFSSAFTFVTSGAFAACNASTGIISINCSDLLLPQTPPGNSNYTISNGTTVEADAFQSSPFFATVAVGVSGSIQSLTNNGTIDGKDKSYGIYLRDTAVSGDITNNNLITGGTRSTFRLRGSTVGGSIVNNGDIIGSQSADISDYSTFIIENTHVYGSVINNGDIINTNTQDTFTIVGSSSSNSIIEFGIFNNGYIRSIGDAIYIKDWSTINGGITNAGEISSSTKHALHIGSESPSSQAVNYVDAINNLSTGEILATSSGNLNTSANIALYVWNASIGMLNNEGLISNTSDGIGRTGSNSPKAVYLRDGATIDEFLNSGEISVIPDDCPDSATCGSGGAAIQIGNPISNTERSVSVGSLTNIGNIYSRTSVDINNLGTLETLNNFQGATGSGISALTYAGNLPSFYNMIVYGDRYGQLAVDSENYNGDGGMMFGIFGGDSANGIAASQLNSRVYEDVVTGVDGVTGPNNGFANTFNTTTPIRNIYGANGAAFGNYNGVAWMLTDATYREGADTAWDLTAFNFGLDLAEPQRAMLEQRQQAIRNGLDYDCAQFDKDGICVSFKARYSSLSDEHEGAGVLVVSKRIDTGLRVGLFVDERIESNTVNNVEMETGMPMLGIFAAYTAGKDGTGLQARISAAYEHGTADITRENMLGTASQVSGKANVDSYGVAQRIGWGFGLGNKNVLTPYLGIRYTEAKRASYDEAYSAGSVIDPFSYAAYGERRTTGTVGADLDGNLSKDVIYRLGGGVDYDFTNSLDTFAISSTYFGDMTYTSAEKARAVRAFGLAGLGYNFDATKTFTLDGNVSQMDYGNDLAYNIWAGFRMGF